MAKIVNTDNFGSDHPDEKFVENLPSMNPETAEHICRAINEIAHAGHGANGGPRHFKVVADDYVLQPGFEP